MSTMIFPGLPSAFCPMSEKEPPGPSLPLHSRSLIIQNSVKKKLRTMETRAQAHPPFLKFFGRYNMPVHTKPLRREKYV